MRHLAFAALLAVSCSSSSREVVVYTSVDQVFSEPIFRAFERRTGISVRAVFDTEETKSTGVVNRLIAEAGHPQADVFWSGDPVRPLLLVRRGLVERWRPPAASGLPSAFRASDGTWSGIAARARVLLVNDGLVPRGEEPTSIRDLASPRWRGRAAIANPLFGTTTMHVGALFAAWGDVAARRFMNDLKTNGVRVASSNGEVKRLVVDGDVAFGLVDTDDAREAMEVRSSVRVVYPDQHGIGTLVIPTTVVLLRDGPHHAEGRALVDGLLAPWVERRLAEEGGHIPLRAGVPTPTGVRGIGEIRAMEVDYARVAAEMERIQPWLRSWAGL